MVKIGHNWPAEYCRRHFAFGGWGGGPPPLLYSSSFLGVYFSHLRILFAPMPATSTPEYYYYGLHDQHAPARAEKRSITWSLVLGVALGTFVVVQLLSHLEIKVGPNGLWQTTTQPLMASHQVSGTLPFQSQTRMQASVGEGEFPSRRQAALMGLTAAGSIYTQPSLAISGGGKGLSGQNIEFQDFSDKVMTGTEFRGALCKYVNFRGTKLQNSQFQKADLRFVDFTGADLSGAALELCTLNDAILDNAILEGAYLGDGLVDVKSIYGADFSDAIIASSYVQKKLCEKAAGTNPVTGVDTRDSLLCA